MADRQRARRSGPTRDARAQVVPLPRSPAASQPAPLAGPRIAEDADRTVVPATLRDGRRRVVIEGIDPEIDGGRFPIKRVVGETVDVEADVYADGHEELTAILRYRAEGDDHWSETAMTPLGNDRWRGSFTVEAVGRYLYTLRGWIDRFGTWRRDLAKKVQAGQDVAVDLLAGAEVVERAAGRARGPDRRSLRAAAEAIREGSTDAALDPELADRMERWPDRWFPTTYERELIVVVDRELARFGAWYELFPRSTGPGTRPGTFATTETVLPYVADMGFDVLYLPPIHPIGHTNRKGPNNDPAGGADVLGSPWAIGSEQGGHTAVDPSLGTLDDFDHLVEAARAHRLEVALDLAFQCSPDHPWVREHPQWFRHRPDGSIQFAENPPKRYEDIYPLDFETDDWRGLWAELRNVMQFWIDRGILIFRVDNPHTKSLPFWEWVIDDLKRDHPDLILLSEAFTRPRVLERLAKLGFTQSYTYFTWRTTNHELESYFTELTQTNVREYLRPNLWTNTPDILTEQLQTGGRPAFIQRLVLAATLGASYGVYGPAFELMEHRPIEAGKEEYLDSEKYEVRDWDLDHPRSLSGFITRLNTIRRDNPAMQSDRSLRFHPVDDDGLIAYSKATPDHGNVILVVVNLDPEYRRSGWVHLWLADLGVADDARPFQVVDLLTGTKYLWQGSSNYVELNPQAIPAHVFLVRRHVRSERDFEYYG